MELFIENVKARMVSTGALSIAFFTFFELLGKKAILEWYMKEGLIAKRAEYPKCVVRCK